MARRGRKPLSSKYEGTDTKLVKRNYYIEERHAKALSILSAITGKELSILVNEAIGMLIKKYQPKTDINLLDLKEVIKA
ncbi:MAG TPA: ribbon-helix-helix domain-containing protein [Deltaproteobacteria bacterium]|nr:ribbon-helix-helix domain-containing protein [Deltaproteobacteria bacterium]HOM29169.1 ribbon-helix-helix domain-containing protein [Deltaproteobacteria bacterium]HPP80434.1 ribbon-helix-helix domain-containing protein [Deltaproteobacteria bacterium]